MSAFLSDHPISLSPRGFRFQCAYAPIPLRLNNNNAAACITVNTNTTNRAAATYQVAVPVVQRGAQQTQVVAYLQGPERAPWHFQLTALRIIGPFHHLTKNTVAELVLEHAALEDPSHKFWMHLSIELANDFGYLPSSDNTNITALARWTESWAHQSSIDTAASFATAQPFSAMIDLQSWVGMSAAATSADAPNCYSYVFSANGSYQYVAVMTQPIVVPSNQFISSVVAAMIDSYLDPTMGMAQRTGRIDTSHETIQLVTPDALATTAGTLPRGAWSTRLQNDRPATGTQFYVTQNTPAVVTSLSVIIIFIFWMILLVYALYDDRFLDWLLDHSGTRFWYVLTSFGAVGFLSILLGVYLPNATSTTWLNSFPVTFGSATLAGAMMFFLVFQTVMRDKHKTMVSPAEAFHMIGQHLNTAWRGRAGDFKTRRYLSHMSMLLPPTPDNPTYTKFHINEYTLIMSNYFPFADKQLSTERLTPEDDLHGEPFMRTWFDFQRNSFDVDNDIPALTRIKVDGVLRKTSRFAPSPEMARILAPFRTPAPTPIGQTITQSIRARIGLPAATAKSTVLAKPQTAAALELWIRKSSTRYPSKPSWEMHWYIQIEERIPPMALHHFTWAIPRRIGGKRKRPITVAELVHLVAKSDDATELPAELKLIRDALSVRASTATASIYPSVSIRLLGAPLRADAHIPEMPESRLVEMAKWLYGIAEEWFGV